MRHFEQELEQLKAKLLEMSALVESAIYRSVRVLSEERSAGPAGLLRNEARVNQLEIEIDELAISLLALQPPMAADLRLVFSTHPVNWRRIVSPISVSMPCVRLILK